MLNNYNIDILCLSLLLYDLVKNEETNYHQPFPQHIIWSTQTTSPTHPQIKLPAPAKSISVTQIYILVESSILMPVSFLCVWENARVWYFFFFFFLFFFISHLLLCLPPPSNLFGGMPPKNNSWRFILDLLLGRYIYVLGSIFYPSKIKRFYIIYQCFLNPIQDQSLAFYLYACWYPIEFF